MGRLKRWWYLSKLLTITIAISTFSTVQAICYLLFAQWFEKLYTIIRKKEPRRQDITNFSFKIFKIMRSLRSSKYLKTKAELMFTTQKANACSHWTACSVFNWKYLFWVNLAQKLEIISLSWNFVPRLIQISRSPCWCSLFLFSTENTFMGKFCPKNQNCQFELKFHTRLIWICRIM